MDDADFYGDVQFFLLSLLLLLPSLPASNRCMLAIFPIFFLYSLLYVDMFGGHANQINIKIWLVCILRAFAAHPSRMRTKLSELKTSNARLHRNISTLHNAAQRIFNFYILPMRNTHTLAHSHTHINARREKNWNKCPEHQLTFNYTLCFTLLLYYHIPDATMQFVPYSVHSKDSNKNQTSTYRFSFLTYVFNTHYNWNGITNSSHL